MADPLLGKMVGEYQVTARISPGDTGGTYRVRHRFLKIDRSLQLIQPADGVLSEVVLEEARLLASIRHKNLVRIHDRGHLEDGGVFFLTELLNGESLRRAIQRAGALPVRDALKILRDVAAGLAEAHALGVVHRAIRPESIFLAREGGVSVAKLIEFGLGLPREQDAVAAMVASGVYAGGAQYAAPEQLGELKPGEAVDSRADVYALGLCLYEALTGRAVFHATAAKAALEERLTSEPGEASARAPQAGIEPELDELLSQMLEVDRAERPSDAREIATSCDKFLLGVRRPQRKIIDSPAADMRYFDTSAPGDVHRPESVRVLPDREAPPAHGVEPEPVVDKAPPAAQEVRRTPPKTHVGRAAVATSRPVPAASPARPAGERKGRRSTAAAAKAEPRAAAPVAPVVSRSGDAGAAKETGRAVDPPADRRDAAPREVAAPALDHPLRRAPEADVFPEQVVARIDHGSPLSTLLPGRAALGARMPVIIAGVVGVVLVVIAIALFAGRGTRPPVVVTVGPDLSSLERALATGDRSSLRGWLRDFPESPHRERAYIALTKVGMTLAEVCRHARTNSPDVLSGAGELATACRDK